MSRRRSARTREKRAQSSDFSGSWMGLAISGAGQEVSTMGARCGRRGILDRPVVRAAFGSRFGGREARE